MQSQHCTYSHLKHNLVDLPSVPVLLCVPSPTSPPHQTHPWLCLSPSTALYFCFSDPKKAAGPKGGNHAEKRDRSSIIFLKKYPFSSMKRGKRGSRGSLLLPQGWHKQGKAFLKSFAFSVPSHLSWGGGRGRNTQILSVPKEEALI